MKFIRAVFYTVTIPIRVLAWMVKVTSTASDSAVEASWKANSRVQSFLGNGPRLVVIVAALFIIAACSGMMS